MVIELPTIFTTPRRAAWLIVASTILLAGAALSLLAATTIVRNDVARTLAVDTANAHSVASSLEVSIQHEQDLAAAANALISSNRNLTNVDFTRWVSEVQVFKRYPEVESVAEVVIVPKDALAAFEKAHGPKFSLISSPLRSFYCLVSVVKNRPSATLLPPGLDYCITPIGPALLATRASGVASYAILSKSTMVVGTPIYTGYTTPVTRAARLASFIGWAGTRIEVTPILRGAIQDHPGSAVTFSYEGAATPTSFSAGPHFSHPTRITVDLHNGWKVHVLTHHTTNTIVSDPSSYHVLLADLILSVLLALFLYVLGTSRSRALLLVKKRTEELEHQSLHDHLTGLPNRALILDRTQRMLLRANSSPHPTAAFFLDIDNFKDINDTLGHQAGDQLLVQVAARLSSVMTANDTVGRLGGDEFVILAEGSSLEGDVLVVANRLLRSLDLPFTVDKDAPPVFITASIGIAQGADITSATLLQDADIALYQAKANGKNRAVEFVPHMQAAVDSNRALGVDLHTALENDEFFLMYQPIISLTSGRVTGVEALLRWAHPRHVVVMPDDFIPALEEGEHLEAIGSWVLREACAQAVQWYKAGYQIDVAVNVASIQLATEKIVTDVGAALHDAGLDPSALILEITERTLMTNTSTMVERLQALRDSGVRIAVDDFGTGYSSLAYLKQFPLDILKVDKTFVSTLGEDPEMLAIVHALTELGHSLSLEVVAEGVETTTQRSILTREGVDTAQGFLFARPLSSKDATKFLADDAAGHDTTGYNTTGHIVPLLPAPTVKRG
jgi:diguanylate cyclase (GGDEF)-like protein